MSVTPFVPACCQCGEPRDERSPDQGRYAKLCESCRREKADAIRARPKPTAPRGQVNLPKVVQQAVAPAKRFQKAIEARHDAKLEAQAALLELNGSLRAISEAAQKLMNSHQSSNAHVESELEPEEEAA